MRLPVAVAVLVLLPHAARADDCASASACNTSGSKHLAAGRIEAAIEDFQWQAGWAEETDATDDDVLAFNNLALAEMKRGKPLMARAWLREARKHQPEASATRFNQGKVDKALAARAIPNSLTGTWRSYAGGGEWNVLDVDDLGKGRLHIGLAALRMGMNWRENGPAAMGGLNENVTLVKGAVTWKAEDCTLTFRFKEDEAVVAQEGGCGFGMGVNASGTYLRTNDAKPTIEEP